MVRHRRPHDRVAQPVHLGQARLEHRGDYSRVPLFEARAAISPLPSEWQGTQNPNMLGSCVSSIRLPYAWWTLLRLLRT
jgi:hypothetical protein